MCSNCSPLRTHAYQDGPCRDADSLTRAVSRRQFLRAGGLGLAGVVGAGALHASAAGNSSMPYVVLIVLDGARPEYFQVGNIPHVEAVVKAGAQYTTAFSGILESETPSGHAAIGTGAMPAQNGVLGFWWGNGQKVKVDLFNPQKIRNGDMERIIWESKIPTLAGRVHARDMSAKVVAVSGSKYYAADAIGGPSADIIMYFYGTTQGTFEPTYVPNHAPPNGVLGAKGLIGPSHGMPLGLENHLAMKLAVRTFKKVKQKVSLINLPEFDWPLGHVDGGVIAQQQVTTLMRSFDRDLAMLQAAYDKAGVLENTIFILMADHGMMPLQHTISEADITTALAKVGATMVTAAYSTGTYIWLEDTGRAVPAARSIAALNNPYIQSVYARVPSGKGFAYTRLSPARLQRTGGVERANQALMQTFNSSSGPDVVVVLAEGVGIEPGGQASWKADHGGTSWQSQHLPLVISGPGVRKNYVSNYPARLIDVAPTVLHLMGASPAGMQGVVLADALNSPIAGDAQRQKAVSAQLTPLVQALQQESRLEVAGHV